MPTCPYCGKVTPQADATYCSYCGSSLAQQTSTSSSFRAQPSQSSYRAGGNSSLNLSERYERALRRAEQMGTAVLILSIVALVLLFV